MQEREFIPKIGMNKKKFWAEVSKRAKEHQGDNILIYMGLMLEKARAEHVPVRRTDIVNYGQQLPLFKGVKDWFDQINRYGRSVGLRVSHHIISSGLREMISGTPIKKHFENIFASSFCYDHHGVAEWPALALNYTTKTQYLFRINKGVHAVYEHDKLNKYVPPSERPVPFPNIVFLGDGETDIPCFRLVKDLRGHSIAVFQPHSRKAKSQAKTLLQDGRVNFIAPADYRGGKAIDQIIKAIMDKIAADDYLERFEP
jgi:hypothetical protein